MIKAIKEEIFLKTFDQKERFLKLLDEAIELSDREDQEGIVFTLSVDIKNGDCKKIWLSKNN